MQREATRYEGAMHAILGLSIDTVQEIIAQVQTEGVVSVANHNTELQIVITGSPGPVEAVSGLAGEQGAKTIPLQVSGAWHSELIRGAEEAFIAFMDPVSFQAPESTVLFNVTAESETDPDAIKSIMAKQLCNPVRWYDIMQKMIENEIEVFAEVGPGRVLTGLIKKTLPKDYPAKVFSVNNLEALEQFFKAVK
jgi:[acyl-carrier-protein] S-malonyltransferase